MAFKDAEFEYYQNFMNAQNQASAKAQMDFQKEMSSTAHQREVEDLIKAGLNPALSLNNGASSPSGAYASVDSTPLSAKSQQKIAKQQVDAQIKMNQDNIKNQYKMNQEQLKNAYKVAELQAYINAQTQKYVSDQNYSLGIYGYDTNAQTARVTNAVTNDYNYLIAKMNNSNENYRQKYGIENPTTVGGTVAKGVRDLSKSNLGKGVKAVLTPMMNTVGLDMQKTAAKSYNKPTSSAKKVNNINHNLVFHQSRETKYNRTVTGIRNQFNTTGQKTIKKSQAKKQMAK